MMMSTADNRPMESDNRSAPLEASWNTTAAPETYHCRVHVYREDDGFCAYAADLPGVVSEGDSEKEAIESIKDAYLGVIASYHAHAEAIPWVAQPPAPGPNESVRWVEIHA
jgi:predicted RNase H-like HicB family nuclease